MVSPFSLVSIAFAACIIATVIAYTDMPGAFAELHAAFETVTLAGSR